MKLVIQIPCFNEAATLPATISGLPAQLSGIDQIETIVIDDGSTDGTARVAADFGVDQVIRLHSHQGLAKAFGVGIETSLSRGADLIVNTDGDNQYRGSDIERLVRPVLEGRADMVVGARNIDRIRHFSRTKKCLQRLGSWAIRWISGTNIPDATSGFRAFSREAALRLNVFTAYTYTLETLIQAGRSNIILASVEVDTNEPLRESRLVKSIPSYIQRSLITMFRIFILYKPLRFFVTLGVLLFSAGFLLGLRFLLYYLMGQGGGMVQSLILASVLLLMGFQLGIVGLLSDLIASNRRILEEIQYRERRRYFE